MGWCEMIPKSFVGQLFSIVLIVGFCIQLLSILYSQEGDRVRVCTVVYYWSRDCIIRKWQFGQVRECKSSTEPIDAVYTWVNGSDPDFIQSLNDYKRGSVQASRYRGKCWGFRVSLIYNHCNPIILDISGTLFILRIHYEGARNGNIIWVTTVINYL